MEQEYKFHDQHRTRVQRRHHYQREMGITINFPRSNNVRINQMRDVEKKWTNEAQNKGVDGDTAREDSFSSNWHKRRDDKGLESVARHSIEELSICN